VCRRRASARGLGHAGPYKLPTTSLVETFERDADVFVGPTELAGLNRLRFREHRWRRGVKRSAIGISEMCGLCGEISWNATPSLVALQSMAQSLAARGPDGEGFFAQQHLAFGHRRLSIIDLASASQQPMIDPQLGLGIVFNGCIYNYQDLKSELTAKGYCFFSNGDTEVILKAYHAWGCHCVERFKGMFAFALWERDSGRVVLARDRLGIKPLYWTRTADALRFASTLPALLAAGEMDTRIDPEGLHHYMSFHAVVPRDKTILAGVRRVPPATLMIIEPDGSYRQQRYWHVDFGPHQGDEKLGEHDWREAVTEAMTTAVRRRLVADVPVGVLLSGGLDSSLIVGLLARLGRGELTPKGHSKLWQIAVLEGWLQSHGIH
jgi:asparagine synthase (glutamine-hydrolysing)